ncbi:MAG: WD40 repeat domain-containing protein [Bacteroidota bacterium]
MSVDVNKLRTLTGHRDCIYTLEPTNEPHLFISGAGDGMVVLWDLNDPENGHLIAKLPNSVYGLHYYAPKNVLIAGHNYDGIHLIDLESRKEVSSLNLTKAAIFDIDSFENLVFVATGDGEVVVVDVNTLQVLKNLKHSEKSARSLAINSDRMELAVGYSDNHIRIFDLRTLEMLQEISAHENSVFTLKYSPDNQLLLSGSRDAHLSIWDAQAGYLALDKIVAHMYAINHLDYSPDGKHFVTCSMDKSIKVWDAQAFKLLKVIDKGRHAGHGTSVNKLLWSKFEDQLVSASDDRTISVWDIQFD